MKAKVEIEGEEIKEEIVSAIMKKDKWLIIECRNSIHMIHPQLVKVKGKVEEEKEAF